MPSVRNTRKSLSTGKHSTSAVVRATDVNICIYVNGVIVDGQNPMVLKIKLPSGRCIHYHKPQVTMEAPPWGGPKRKQVSYEAWDKKGKQIKRLYGGLICENVVQAVARDLLLSGMISAEKAGGRIIMTIHDEVVVETSLDSGFTLEILLKCMTTLLVGGRNGFYSGSRRLVRALLQKMIQEI